MSSGGYPYKQQSQPSQSQFYNSNSNSSTRSHKSSGYNIHKNPVTIVSPSAITTPIMSSSFPLTPSTENTVALSTTTTTTTTTTTSPTILNTTRLTVKSHPFIGAILSPKHAIELTPTLCLQIASALADLNMISSSSSSVVTSSGTTHTNTNNISTTNSNNNNSMNHQRLHSPTQSTNKKHLSSYHPPPQQQQQQQQSRGAIVPYTVWITEAWRVLGWAEPSAALFWEMATMYYALILSQREVSNYYYYNHNNNHHSHHHWMYSPRTNTYMIPPILSCSSTGSVGSHGTTAERTPTHNSHPNHFPYHQSNNTNDSSHNKNKGTTPSRLPNSVASAKELPVWLVSTFLLLHCEEFAIQRNLSGQPALSLLQQQQQHHTIDHHSSSNISNTTNVGPGGTQRFGTNTYGKSTSLEIHTAATGKMDFSTLFNYPSSFSRTRLHSTWQNDHRHCIAYLLRHLRKVLLLCAISHSKEAQVACLHLASMPTPNDVILSSLSSATMSSSSSAVLNNTNKSKSGVGTTMVSNKNYDADAIRRLHDDEHGNVGLQVRLTMEDLECLDFVLQPPNGGMMDEPCIRIGELMWRDVYNDPYPPPTANIPLADVERVLREYLERELSSENSGLDDSINANANCDIQKQQRSNKKKGQRRNDDSTTTTPTTAIATDDATGAMSRLSLSDRKQSSREKSDSDDIGKPCSKEIKYTRLRGTTVLLKPNPPDPPSAAVSVASGEPSYYQPHTGGALPGRLHDLVVSDCSDAHFYLLQPFEHVTIAACTGCTIVIGAVAGLLHIVDCEKTIITFAARRVLISNSCDMQSFLFTPSPPLLVGENRTCQFAPYNTYYDGMREDLLIAGLAAPAMNDHSRSDNDALYPLLQCASNKWKQPIELSKLEVPQIPGSSAQSVGSAPLSPGADDRAMATNMNDTTMQVPVLIPPSEYHILFVPIESETSRQRRLEIENGENASGDGNSNGPIAIGAESQYCRLLAEVLQLSPFRLPLEYERSALMKAERMKNIQQAVQKNLSPEQQQRFEEELNRGFRDWLVSSGNLRQVLDLVHMENKEKVGSQ